MRRRSKLENSPLPLTSPVTLASLRISPVTSPLECATDNEKVVKNKLSLMNRIGLVLFVLLKCVKEHNMEA